MKFKTIYLFNNAPKCTCGTRMQFAGEPNTWYCPRCNATVTIG